MENKEDLYKNVRDLNRYIGDYIAFLESKYNVTVKEIRVKRIKGNKLDIVWKVERTVIVNLSEGDADGKS